jgi:putative drug exporter of the RND superfamily
MTSLARWCFRHRWLVVALWLVASLGSTIAYHGIGGNFSSNLVLSGTQSYDASALLSRATPPTTGDSEQIVFAVSRGTVRAAAVVRRTDRLLGQIAKLPHVTAVGSPYTAADASQIGRSGKVAYANVTFDVNSSAVPSSEASRYVSLVTGASRRGLDYQAQGDVAANGSPSGSSTALPIGFVAAGLVLLLVFGTLLATALPLLTAAVSLGTGIAVVGLLSNVFSMASFASELALLVGLGVGVDYALFIVTRYRQGRLRGLPIEEAVIQALDTSGRAVMFAGMTVCIAMLGMVALGVSFLYGVAIAASITVAFTVIAALTLLPALLSLFGERVMRRRDRRAIAAGQFCTCDESPGWARWVAIVQRRPAVFAAIAAAIMLVFAAPAMSMRLGSADQSNNSAGSTNYKAYNLLAEGFGPGSNGPLVLVATVTSPAQRDDFATLVASAARNPDVASVSAPSLLPLRIDGARIAVANVVPKGSPQAVSTANLVTSLRNTTIPAIAARSGLHVLVGGQTATFIDIASVLSQKLPLFVGVVVALSCLLLTAVFRSLAIPLTAALMNLLSTGSSLGIVTAIFQFGWLRGLFGVTSTGPIESFLPVLLFPILFGLSMDYEVFLVSRMREEWTRRADNREAVAHGLAATGKTINAAAAIMVLVFAAFVLGGGRIIELFGIGLASAVLFDAVIVRSVIVPSVMLLLGDVNWHLPPILARILPQLRLEGTPLEPVLEPPVV